MVLVGGFLELSREGDREFVQRGLLPHYPACPAPPMGSSNLFIRYKHVNAAARSGTIPTPGSTAGSER